MAKIILSVKKEINFKKLISQIKEFDLLELRIDQYPFSNEEIINLIKNLNKKIILKLPSDENLINKYEIHFSDEKILIDLDFPFFEKIRCLKKLPLKRLIISHHNFYSSHDLLKKTYEIKKYKDSFLKIIGTYNSEKDLEVIENIYQLVKNKKRTISFLMGNNIGTFTRFYSIKLGNPFFYTHFEDATAPGQISLDEIKKNRYDPRKINSKTDFYSLIGSPIKHSLSPPIHNFIFELLSKNRFYTKIEMEDLHKETFSLIKKYFKGISITSPLKTKCLKFIDKNKNAFESINTIKFFNGLSYGYNTDIPGFKKALLKLLKGEKIKEALVIGTGGSAKAIIRALKELNIKIKIYGRNREKVKRLSEEYNVEIATKNGKYDYQLIINCTTAGSTSQMDEIPLPEEMISGKYLFDLIYSPPKTKLMKISERKNLKTTNGLNMLIYQAIEQEKIWGLNIENDEEMFQNVKKTILNHLNYLE